MYVHKVLIANRGEIAVRIIRACRELGHAHGGGLLRGRTAPPCTPRLRTRRVCIGPAATKDSYLNMQRHPRRLRASPARTRCIPGFGFLSENADFARLCEHMRREIYRARRRKPSS